MRSVNNSVETINAAATAIITAESRVQPATVQVYLLICLILIRVPFYLWSVEMYGFVFN